MTQHVDVAGIRFVTIAKEDSRTCQMCGKFAETRPYGPGGVRVCFQCGMKNDKEARCQFLGDKVPD